MVIRDLVAPATAESSGASTPMHIPPQLDTKGTASTASTPRSTVSRPGVPPVQQEDYKLLKHQLTSANRTIEDQANRITRLEAIVMSLKEPAVSPSPRNRQIPDQTQLVEELKSEITILKEKVVKLMNENARLRMAFSTVPRHSTGSPNVLATMSALPVPPPPHPVARSPGRPFRPA
jgi:hypothetical protein